MARTLLIGDEVAIPTGTVEYLEKRANEVIYATGTLRGAKVGFTG